MQFIDVAKYCLSLPGAERIAASESGNAFKFCVDDLAFAWFETGAPVAWHFSLRVDESELDALLNPPKVTRATDKTDDHWITIGRVEDFDGELLKEKIQWSYGRVIECIDSI